jgi:hypothetical protein
VNRPITTLPAHRIETFRLFAADDPHDTGFPNWSRAYEWCHALERLRPAASQTVHNTCCGYLDGHALFHDRLAAACPRTVNSDILPRGRNRGFRGFFRYDLREPLDRTFDHVLCISTLEEVFLREPHPAIVARVLHNLLAQLAIGGRLIVTCDVSTPDKEIYRSSGAIEIGVLEAILGARCGLPRDPLTGLSSVFQDPAYADLRVCLIELTRILPDHTDALDAARDPRVPSR